MNGIQAARNKFLKSQFDLIVLFLIRVRLTKVKLAHFKARMLRSRERTRKAQTWSYRKSDLIDDVGIALGEY